MKNMYRFIIALAVLAFGAVTLSAQREGDYIVIDGERYQLKKVEESKPRQEPQLKLAEPTTLELRTVKSRPLKVNWKPEHKIAQRYTIGIQPLELINFGLKADFGFELGRPGNWLQFQLSGYYSPWYDGRYDYYDPAGRPEESRLGGYAYYDNYYGGWNTFMSSFYNFQKLGGVGLAITYKNMFGPRGWYLSYSASFNYYDVHHSATRSGMMPFTDSGQTFYEVRTERFNHRTKFYKPGLAINLGKHFTLGRNIYLDMYGGLGFAYSFYDDQGHKYSYDYDNGYSPIFDGAGMYSFGYQGLTFSGGIRLGILWSRNLAAPGD